MKKISCLCLTIICLWLHTGIFAQPDKKPKANPSMADVQKMISRLRPEQQAMMKNAMKNMNTSNGQNMQAKAGANLRSDATEKEKLKSIGAITTKRIGAQGGTITSTNSKITLSFPAGALKEDTQIGIEEIENNSEIGNGNAFQLLPEGIKFEKNVKLILTYSNEEIVGSQPEALCIITQNSDGKWLLNLTSQVDTNTHSISASIKHFSKWGYGSKSKMFLAPKSKFLPKGQFVNLSIEGWEVSPQKMDEKSAEVKELAQKRKDLARLESPRDEYMITKIKGEIEDLIKSLGTDDDELVPLKKVNYTENNFRYSVVDWALNSVKAPVSNLSGSLSPQGFTARFTAPKTITGSNAIALVMVNLISIDNKSIKIRLISKIEMIENGFLNYTVDGKDVSTLETDGYSPAFVNMVREKGDRALDDPLAVCFLDKNELTFGTFSHQTKNQIYISFKVKNPGIGQNLIHCDDSQRQLRNGARVWVILTQGERKDYVNSNVTRKKSGTDGCEGRDDCTVFELTLTEFEPKDRGTVAGYFSGTLYEDNEDFSKNCINADPHFISGNFSLVITSGPQ